MISGVTAKIKDIKIILSDSKNGWDFKTISVDELKELFNNDFSQSYDLYINKKAYIQRYENHLPHDRISLLNPSQRYSIGGSPNIYTNLFSHILPSWKKYPKRDHCVIGTLLDKLGSSKYDNNAKYIIFPKNDTICGICSNNDIWYSFENSSLSNEVTNFDLTEFENNLLIISRYFNYSDQDFKDFKTLLKFLKVDIKKMNDKIYNNIMESNFSNFFKIIYDNKDNLISFFDEVFNPEKNGIILKKLHELPNYASEYNNKELWFDNQCLAIPRTIKEQVGL